MLVKHVKHVFLQHLKLYWEISTNKSDNGSWGFRSINSSKVLRALIVDQIPKGQTPLIFQYYNKSIKDIISETKYYQHLMPLLSSAANFTETLDTYIIAHKHTQTITVS